MHLVAAHLFRCDAETIKRQSKPRFRDFLGVVNEQTSQRFVGVVEGQLEVKAFIEVLHIQPGRKPPNARFQRFFDQVFLVVLVFDVTDQLFHDVLHGQNP